VLVVAVAVAGVSGIAFGGYVVNYCSVPIATIIGTSGIVGDVTIGESKTAILASLKNQAFSPDPKPIECPANWIDVSQMTDVQHGCLTKTNLWHEGYPSTTTLCPKNVNVFTDLRFEADTLKSVTTTCRHPE
jgi:hypothetical protein